MRTADALQRINANPTRDLISLRLDVRRALRQIRTLIRARSCWCSCSDSAVLPGRTWNVTRVSIICDLRKSRCPPRHAGHDAADDCEKPRELYRLPEAPRERVDRFDDADVVNGETVRRKEQWQHSPGYAVVQVVHQARLTDAEHRSLSRLRIQLWRQMPRRCIWHP